MSSTGRGGRRPGSPDTREEILAAARKAFASSGYDASTVRGIAGAAGVDPALIHHYFGSKKELFLAVIEPPADPVATLAPVVEAGPDDVGAHLVRAFLSVWDGPSGSRVSAMLRSAVTDEVTARLLKEFFVIQVIGPVLQGCGVPAREVPRRAGLVATQMIGLALLRHVMPLEPVAALSTDELVAAIGPTVQRYVTGDLGRS